MELAQSSTSTESTTSATRKRPTQSLDSSSMSERSSSDIRAQFDSDIEEYEEEEALNEFISWAPKRPTPWGLSWAYLNASKYRALAAGILLISLSILFAVVGTQTFWSERLTWKGWYTLFVITVMLSALVLDMWDVSLTFFLANTALLLARIITIPEALSGFSNEGILSTAVMFVIAKAIEKTRVLEWVVRVVLRRPQSLRNALTRILPAVAFWSFWTNNTPIVAVMIPVVETWSTRTGIPVSQLLMPVSFAVILGGLVTTIGTSTNLVVQGLAGDIPLGFFEIGALGGPFTIIGIIYMIAFGPFLLPKAAVKGYAPQVYAWHRLTSKSPHIGRTLLETKLVKLPGTELLWLKPSDETAAHFVPDTKGKLEERDSKLPVFSRQLQAGDLLCFIGTKECVEDIPGCAMSWYAGSQLHGLSFFEIHLASNFSDVPMSVKDFNANFKCRVRRISHDGNFLHMGSGNIRDGKAKLEAGDIAIAEGGFGLLHLQQDPRIKKVAELNFTVGKVQSTLPLAETLHPIISVLVLLFIVMFNAAGLLSIYEAAAIGIIVLLVTDTMNWTDVVRAIPGNLMIMICYSFALAKAMDKSGLGTLIGESFAIAFVGHPYVQLMGIYLCASILTAIAPNSAVATIVFPIVVSMSESGGFNILAGIYILMVASSSDFLTPFGYQCNLMIQRPGGYTFSDYTKLGGPLTLIGLFLCPGIAMYAWPPVPCNATAFPNCTNSTIITNMTNYTS